MWGMPAQGDILKRWRLEGELISGLVKEWVVKDWGIELGSGGWRWRPHASAARSWANKTAAAVCRASLCDPCHKKPLQQGSQSEARRKKWRGIQGGPSGFQGFSRGKPGKAACGGCVTINATNGARRMPQTPPIKKSEPTPEAARTSLNPARHQPMTGRPALAVRSTQRRMRKEA
jgi:hypothetical protein